GRAGLVGFALPPLVGLGRGSPLRGRRRELTPLPGSGWFIYGLALSALSLLMRQFTGNLPMSLAVIPGGAIAALLLGILAWLLLRASGELLRHLGLYRPPCRCPPHTLHA